MIHSANPHYLVSKLMFSFTCCMDDTCDYIDYNLKRLGLVDQKIIVAFILVKIVSFVTQCDLTFFRALNNKISLPVLL